MCISNYIGFPYVPVFIRVLASLSLSIEELEIIFTLLFFLQLYISTRILLYLCLCQIIVF